MKKYCQVSGFLCLVCVLLILGKVPAFSAGQNLQLPDWLSLSGWLDTVHAWKIEKPNKKLTSRARLRLEAKADLIWVYLFSSLDAEKNWVVSKENGVDLHELWTEHVEDIWDLRIGRQTIIWGQADGVRITDMIAPLNLSDPITRDLDEIRMPVDAARFRVLTNTLTTELILIPFFQESLYPENGNLWAMPLGAQPGRARIQSAKKPARTMENMEFAAKISSYLPGLDVAASVFYTWDDNPVILQGNRPKYHRLTIFGLSFAMPLPEFVFRGEGALYRDQYLPCSSPGREPLGKYVFKWLAGLDWTPGYDWTITAQLVGKYIDDYEPILADRRNSLMTTLNISKKVLNQRLTLSNMVYFDCDNIGIYDRIKADLEVVENFHISTGVDFFQGHKGLFDAYEKNTHMWVKAKYNF